MKDMGALQQKLAATRQWWRTTRILSGLAWTKGEQLGAPDQRDPQRMDAVERAPHLIGAGDAGDDEDCDCGNGGSQGREQDRADLGSHVVDDIEPGTGRAPPGARRRSEIHRRQVAGAPNPLACRRPC